MASRGRARWKPQHRSGFGFGAEAQSSDIPHALIKNARHSGQINLSNRDLTEVPMQVWRINLDVPEEGRSVSLDTGDGDRWWEQVDLRKLILASNKLKELSSEIKNLPALNVLDAHDNLLESLPDEIGELQELARINLSHNNFSTFPWCLTKLQSARVLILNGNKFEGIPEEFGNLVHAEDINLEENMITSLPESFGNLCKLLKLNLSKNQLESIPTSFQSLVAIKDLNLRSNKLKSLPQGLERMKSLDILDCRANVISEFPSINGPVNVKELYLSNNRIKRIDSSMFKHLPMLVTLDLKDNTIDCVPEEITLCTNLERLDLTNNCICILPFSIGNMENIKAISLDGNPLRGIRRDIVAKGTQAVLKYLKSRIQSEEEQNCCKRATGDEKRGEINDNFMPHVKEIDTHTITTTRKIDYCNKKADSIPGTCFIDGVAVSVIDFSKNSLNMVPERIASYASSLVDLNLSYNQLTSLPVELACLSKLNFINISNNKIESLSLEFKSWQSLRQITLSSNRFIAIPVFLYEIQSLETLLARSNRVAEINVDGLKQLPNIVNLDLSNNNISSVPAELGNVRTLRSLQLEGNAFRNPRHAILVKGTVSILEYLRDRIPR